MGGTQLNGSSLKAGGGGGGWGGGKSQGGEEKEDRKLWAKFEISVSPSSVWTRGRKVEES